MRYCRIPITKITVTNRDYYQDFVRAELGFWGFQLDWPVTVMGDDRTDSIRFSQPHLNDLIPNNWSAVWTGQE